MLVIFFVVRAMRSKQRHHQSSFIATPPRASVSKMRSSPHFVTPEARKGSFPPLVHATVPPHTLLLGTQPSDTSLRGSGYYLSNNNAFWHIVGDALGFRRGFHVDGRTEAVDFIRTHLLHNESLDYDAAVERLTAAGYAVWDTVATSRRKGSVDSNIRDPTFADVRSLVAQYPSIVKICFSTGKGSAEIFKRAHRDWLREGGFRARADEASRDVFGDLPRRPGAADEDLIELCVMASVSPASNPRQTMSAEKQRKLNFDDEWTRRPVHVYPWKRAQWFEACFAREIRVQAAPKLGDLESHFR